MLRVALVVALLPGAAIAQPSESVPVAPVTLATTPRHEGLTFEASAGLGRVRSSPSRAPSYTSGMSYALDVGVGAWLTPQLALTGRFAGVTSIEDGERFGAYFMGPSVQYWADRKLWVGGGAGLGILGSSTSDDELGFAFDLRAGYVVSVRPDYALSVSLEVTPARFIASGDSATLTGVAVLCGFQYL